MSAIRWLRGVGGEGGEEGQSSPGRGEAGPSVGDEREKRGNVLLHFEDVRVRRDPHGQKRPRRT